MVPCSHFHSSRVTSFESTSSLEWDFAGSGFSADCSGLWFLFHLLIFLSSLHSQQVPPCVALTCIVSDTLWPGELGVFVPEPLRGGSGRICRIPTALFRLFEEMLRFG